MYFCIHRPEYINAEKLEINRTKLIKSKFLEVKKWKKSLNT